MEHPVDVWFVCKLCQGLFKQVSRLIQHKFENHSREFKTVKSIIFEEKGTLRPPEPEPEPGSDIIDIDSVFLEDGLASTRLTRLPTHDLNISKTNDLNITDTSASNLSLIQDQDQTQDQLQLQLDKPISTSPSKDESPQLYSCKFTNIQPDDAVVFTRKDGCLTINISRFSPSQTPTGPTRVNLELEAGAPGPLPSPVLTPQEEIYQELETVGLPFDDVSLSATALELEATQVIDTNFISTMYETAHLDMHPEPTVEDFEAPVSILDTPENDLSGTEGILTHAKKNCPCESIDLDEILNDLPDTIFETDLAVALPVLDLNHIELPIPIPLLSPSLEAEMESLTEIPVTNFDARPLQVLEIETQTELIITGQKEEEAILGENFKCAPKPNLNSVQNPYVLLRRLNSEQLKLATNRNSIKKIQPDSANDPDFDPEIHTSSDLDLVCDLKPPKLKPFGCSVCNRAFESRPRLWVHMKGHSSVKPFKCTHRNCNSSFVHKHSLEDHLKRHKNPASKIYYVFPDHLDEEEETKTNRGHEGHHDDLVKLTSILTLTEWLQKEQSNTENIILLNPEVSKLEKVGPISLTNPISCKLCTRILTSDKEVKIHVRHCWTHNVLRHRYCVSCKKPFSHPSDLKIHNGKFHSNNEAKIDPDFDIDTKVQHLLKCMHCSKQYVNFRDFEIHQQTHKRGGEKAKPTNSAPAVICPICGYPCLQKSYLAAHLKTHSNVKEFKCSEPQCTVICKTKTSLTAHIRRMHHAACDTRPFKCPVLHCGHTYKSNDAFKSHLLTHTVSKSDTSASKCFACPQKICGKIYFNNKSLKIHMKKVHNLDTEIERPSLSCKMCRQIFSTEISLKLHYCGRSTSKIFNCTVENCTAAFKQRYRLVNHEREHSGQNPYVCDTCGKSYAKSVSFYKHRKTHETELKVKFSCHLCPRKFPGRWELKQHLLVHEKGAQFVCQFCGKKCAKKENLVMHEKSHTKREAKKHANITSDGGDLSGSSFNSNSGAAMDSDAEAAAEALIAKFPEFFFN